MRKGLMMNPTVWIGAMIYILDMIGYTWSVANVGSKWRFVCPNSKLLRYTSIHRHSGGYR